MRVASFALHTLLLSVACGPLPPAAPPPRIESIMQRYDDSTLVLRIDPLEHYTRWAELVEQCSGLAQGDDDDTDTYWIGPRESLGTTRKDSIVLYTHAMHDTNHHVVFATGYEADSAVFMHEHLHHLLDINGLHRQSRDHDPEYFVKRCGTLIR